MKTISSVKENVLSITETPTHFIAERLVVFSPRQLTWRDYLRWSNEFGAIPSTKVYVNGRRVE